MFEHANTRKHISEQSWLCGWIILKTLAHLAHLAQFYFSLIFSAINTYNCFWFDLTKKISVAEDKSMVKSDKCLRLFSSRRQPPLHIGWNRPFWGKNCRDFHEVFSLISLIARRGEQKMELNSVRGS